MSKPLVFISHITEEKQIALAIKELLEEAYVDQIEVFVSSSKRSIRVGDEWFQKIRDSLERCELEIVLTSPNSIRRPWVNFEAGAGWIRKIPVIPLCHSGLQISKLPPPLQNLQAVLATDATGLGNIFERISEVLGCRVPQVNCSKFIDLVAKFEVESQQIEQFESQIVNSPKDGLLPHELATLVVIAETTGCPTGSVSVFTLTKEVEKTGYRTIAVTVSLGSLRRKGLVELFEEYDDWKHNSYTAIRLTPERLEWLEKNIDQFELTYESHQNEDEQSRSDGSGDEVPF